MQILESCKVNGSKLRVWTNKILQYDHSNQSSLAVPVLLNVSFMFFSILIITFGIFALF